MPMRIATWNVNSIRVRLGRVVEWLRRNEPDVLCLQETKVGDEEFPRAALEDEGYNVVCFGQAGYNGVAILARHDVTGVQKGMAGEPGDADRRFLGALVAGTWQVLCVYVPNGQAVGHPKFHWKLDWLRRLRACLDEHYDPRRLVLVLGDWNVTLDDRDVWDPVQLRETIHCSTPERETVAHVLGFGLHDALRKHHQQGGIYTWWDYRTEMLGRTNRGLRIDHVMASAGALERCTAVTVHEPERAGRGASDHVPVVAEFA
jgi:exodeoxyribonuclease-3